MKRIIVILLSICLLVIVSAPTGMRLGSSALAADVAILTCVEGGNLGLVVKFSSRSDAAPPAKGDDCADAIKTLLDAGYTITNVQGASNFKGTLITANGAWYTLAK